MAQEQTVDANRDAIVDEIRAERNRQVEHEGFSLAHDDAWENGELALAASTYALPPRKRIFWTPTSDKAPMFWPFAPEWYKPKIGSRRRELVMAAALIVAEIERLDRAAERGEIERDAPEEKIEKLQRHISNMDEVELIGFAKMLSLAGGGVINDEEKCFTLACRRISEAVGEEIEVADVSRCVEKESMRRWLAKLQ